MATDNPVEYGQQAARENAEREQHRGLKVVVQAAPPSVSQPKVRRISRRKSS